MPGSESKSFDPREFMESAIEVMNQSVPETRKDKNSPNVGVVLVNQDGTIIDTASRGEIRHGDHAEFTLLERKNRDKPLDGAYLFVTLEPCAPGSRHHPKLNCAERIVNARIEKVWIGIEDPDPNVDRKGIQHLLDNGVEVEMFDSGLQKPIRESNKKFIAEAEERAKHGEEEATEIELSPKDKNVPNVNLESMSKEVVQEFIEKAGLGVEFGSDEFVQKFLELGLLEKTNDDGAVPTGWGLLLFGERPQLSYHNALIRATYQSEHTGEQTDTFEGPLVKQTQKAIEWFSGKVGYRESRAQSQRQKVYNYPPEVIREAITNAILHRDYDIDGAPTHFQITDNLIMIKSPGGPVPPIKPEDIKGFNAPALSRNPKIMYVFDQMELSEQRGLGFKTIRELPEKYNLPLPQVFFEDFYMVFKFPRSNKVITEVSDESGVNQLNEEELRGFDWIKLQGEISTREYSQHFDIGYKKAQRHLTKMRKLGLLTDNRKAPNSPKYRYLVNYDDNEVSQ